MDNTFENLLSLSDASLMWHLEESTLRKAIAANKFVIGEDVKKFGKQWIIRKQAMERVYGYLSSTNLADIKISDTKKRQIFYFIVECFNTYCRKYKKKNKEVTNNFNTFHIYEYLFECYDYLHLQSVNETVKDINSRIRRGIVYA